MFCVEITKRLSLFFSLRMMASIRVCTVHEYVKLAVATSGNHSDGIIINSDHSYRPLHVQWIYTLCFATLIIVFTLVGLFWSQCHVIQVKNYPIRYRNSRIPKDSDDGVSHSGRIQRFGLALSSRPKECLHPSREDGTDTVSKTLYCFVF